MARKVTVLEFQAIYPSAQKRMTHSNKVSPMGPFAWYSGSTISEVDLVQEFSEVNQWVKHPDHSGAGVSSLPVEFQRESQIGGSQWSATHRQSAQGPWLLHQCHPKLANPLSSNKNIQQLRCWSWMRVNSFAFVMKTVTSQSRCYLYSVLVAGIRIQWRRVTIHQGPCQLLSSWLRFYPNKLGIWHIHSRLGYHLPQLRPKDWNLFVQMAGLKALETNAIPTPYKYHPNAMKNTSLTSWTFMNPYSSPGDAFKRKLLSTSSTGVMTCNLASCYSQPNPTHPNGSAQLRYSAGSPLVQDPRL